MVADALGSQDQIKRVRYPHHPNHPSYDLAKQQMSKGGGMLSFELAGGEEMALRIASKVKLFVNATSLGGVESLIEHRASVEGPNSATPDGLLRLSIGLENPQDLIEDLIRSLK